MMKRNVTELVFILDKSGSMAGLEAGYNWWFQCDADETTKS